MLINSEILKRVSNPERFNPRTYIHIVYLKIVRKLMFGIKKRDRKMAWNLKQIRIYIGHVCRENLDTLKYPTFEARVIFFLLEYIKTTRSSSSLSSSHSLFLASNKIVGIPKRGRIQGIKIHKSAIRVFTLFRYSE